MATNVKTVVELSGPAHGPTHARGEEPSAIRRIEPEPMADQCARADAGVKGALFRLRDSANNAITAGLELVRETRKTKSGQIKAVRLDTPRDEFEPGEHTKQFEALRPTR